MIRVRAPGRITLSGEHQDYLGFPVLTLAISRYIYLEAERIPESFFQIELPNINHFLEIPLKNKELEYSNKRDYLRSGYNIFLRKGACFNKGYRIRIIGDIPINAGVASSSALVITWLFFMNLISDLKLSNFQLANEGYNAEVNEFQEAGGMMDHFNSVYGKLIYLEASNPKPNPLNFDPQLTGIVLGDSMECKNTVDDLIRVKSKSITVFNELKKVMPEFNQYTTQLDELNQILPNIKKQSQKLLVGNIINRDITYQMKKLFFNNLNVSSSRKNFNFYQKLGELLNLHQKQLRENIQISTKKIDLMIKSCIESGAYGGKINGSGFGGTMFAIMPGNEQKLISAIEEAGGKGSIIQTSNGVETY